MPRVFISHSAKDRDQVQRHVISFLREHGIETWYSTDNIKKASDWERQIRAGLEQCDWFLVAVSPHAIDSLWVRTEVHWALEEMTGKVIPVLLEDCDPSKLHLMLRLIQYIDFREDANKAQQELLSTWGLDTATKVANQYKIAHGAVAEKDWAAAIAHLEEVLRLDPAHGDATAELDRARQVVNRYQSGREAMAREDWATAIRHLDAVLRLDPTHDDAKTELDRARRQDEIARQYAAGLTHFAEGRSREALKAFRLVRGLDKNFRDISERIADADAEVAREDALRDRERRNQKKPNQQETIQTNPIPARVKPPRIRPSLQTLLPANLNEALTESGVKNLLDKYLLTKTAAMIGGSLIIIVAAIFSLPWFISRPATNTNNGGTPPVSNVLTAKANPSVPPVSDEELSKSGDRLFNERKYAEAASVYERAIQQQPNDGNLHLKRGKALFAQANYAKATEVLKTATELLPNNAEAYAYYGRALYESDQYDEAPKQLTEATRLDPNNAGYYFYLGEAFSWQDKWCDTAKAYEKTLQIDRTHEEARKNLKGAQRACKLSA